MLKSIKKFIALTIITTTILGTSSIGANAEWKSDSQGWWNTEGNSYSVGWKQIDSKWYYFDKSGYMVTNTEINGYKIDNNGVWNQNTTNNINSNNSIINNINNGQIINNNIQTNTVNNNSSGNTNTSNVESLSDLQDSLNTKYNTLDTPIGKLKFKFTIDTDKLGISDYDCWVQTDFGEITNSPYEITFFSPYLLEYSTKISDNDKEKTKELLRNYQKYIGEAFISGCSKNNKKVMGGFYTGFYKYPNLKVGYESTKFLTWRNYDDKGNITNFNWYTQLDDYNFSE